MTAETTRKAEVSTRRAPGRDRKSMWSALAVSAAGGLVVWLGAIGVVASVLLLMLAREHGVSAMIAPLLGGAASAGVLYVGARLKNYGNKLLAIDADTLMARDRRAPVLYLRSFRHDAIPAGERANTQIAGLALGVVGTMLGISASRLITEEEEMARQMSVFGPFVAVGRPNEALPELGAARLYVADDEWRVRVEQLMARSQLVLLRSGASEGLMWEIRRAIEKVPAERMIFWLPFEPGEQGERQYQEFRHQVKEALPSELPERCGGAKFLFFDADWAAHLSSSMYSRAFRPIYDRLGVKPRRPPIIRFGFVLKATVTLILGVVIAILISLRGN